MLLEWYFALSNDLQQLWDSIVYYFTTPFASEVIQESVLIFWSSFFQPIILLAVPLLLLLMFSAIVIGNVAFRYDSYKEKKNQMEIILSLRQQIEAENSA